MTSRLDTLYRHCADLGLNVEWADLGPCLRGDYDDDLLLVRLNRRLTEAEAASTLAHEVGHHLAGDRCSSPAAERRAWETGAALLLTRREYEMAETLVGSHPNALAIELGVTPKVITAWRRWFKRRHGGYGN